MKQQRKELPETAHRYLSSLHADAWKVEGELREQRFRTFESAIIKLGDRGYDVREYVERLEKYELSKKIQERR